MTSHKYPVKSQGLSVIHYWNTDKREKIKKIKKKRLKTIAAVVSKNHTKEKKKIVYIERFLEVSLQLIQLVFIMFMINLMVLVKP